MSHEFSLRDICERKFNKREIRLEYVHHSHLQLCTLSFKDKGCPNVFISLQQKLNFLVTDTCHSG